MFGKNKNQIKNNCVSKNKIANAKIFAHPCDTPEMFL